MTEKIPTKSFAFDQRNVADFDVLTKRIFAALEKMAADRKEKRTQANLAALSGCTRGTLRNRKWPLEALDKLVEEAKQYKIEKAKAKEAPPRSAKDITQVERLQEQLGKNRDELLMWKFKHDDLKKAMKTIEGQRDRWKNIAEKYEAELKALKLASAASSQTKAQVIPFASASPAPSDTTKG
ncbi:hypothetical protein J8I26_06585 [Herbaspirillum sp. LeCh32-8]|uniref:hypothetical protein n=1 Tax=Herbaspirillum sp. LeCh32-8 TaxID=2821356 RepID=UPI001AEB2A7E|nr:hypothetical protein [Herbaspirillum sp. LeCh32-8]MBP0597760.1 hypothetical protein [Herbaspirillum sp. LeCh32-8]